MPGDQMAHDGVVLVGVDAQVGHASLTEVHTGGKQAVNRAVAGHPVDGAVGCAGAPGPLDDAVVGLIPQAEDKGPMDDSVLVKDVQLTPLQIRLQILREGVTVAPLGGVAVLGHEAAGRAVDGTQSGQIVGPRRPDHGCRLCGPRARPIGTQEGFQMDLLRPQTAGFVKFYGGGIAAPYIERQIIAPAFPGEFRRVGIEGPADVLPPKRLVHTQIINVKSFYIRQDVVIDILLKLTEDVAQHPLPVVHGHKNGRIFIVYFLTQLGIRVLSAPGPEEIRSPGVMHLSHLSQKFMDAGDVSLLCSANKHRYLLPNRPRGAPAERGPLSCVQEQIIPRSAPADKAGAPAGGPFPERTGPGSQNFDCL